MKILKIIFGNLIVDTLFGLVTLGMLIAWVVNNNNNFSGWLCAVFLYVTFNIINKVIQILKSQNNG